MLINTMLNANVQFVSKRFTSTSIKLQLLKQLFGAPLSKAQGIDNLDVSEKQLKEGADFCEKVGFSKEEWIRHPNLFKLNKYHLEFQYLNLKEGGFVDINPKILSSSRGCISKKVSILKDYNFIPNDVNVAEKFASHLKLSNKQLKIDDLTDERKYEDIYKTILLRYLMIKFNITEDNVKKYEKHIRKEARSFVLLEKNLSYLEELGISRDRLLNTGIALTTHLDCNRELVQKVSQLGNLNFVDNIKRYPLFLNVKYENYVEIYGHLKKFKFSDKTIQNCMRIFLFHPDTVKVRLIEIQSIPELSVLSDNIPTLQLVIKHNQARSKLSFLDSINFKHRRFSVLNGSAKTFKNYVENELDANYNKEVYLLLQHLLKNVDHQVINNFKKHVRYCQVPLLEIEKSYNFIKSFFKFSDESIAAAVQILLYPSDNFEEVHRVIFMIYRLPRKPTEIETLNLMIYHMEKDSRFLGCAAETIRKESATKSGVVDNEPLGLYEAK